jgi:heme exporter protein B
MLPAIRTLIARDVAIALRRRADALAALFFFVVTASLFPLALGPQPELLRAIGPGLIWVAALLAAMLSLPRIFTADYQDGALEQMILLSTPLSLLVLAKIFAHWLTTGVPLAVLAPLLGLQFGLPAESLATLVMSLLLGTPVLSLLGAIGAALTLGLRGSSALIALLTLPLYIPVLIFGVGAVEQAASSGAVAPYLSLLAACLLMAVVLAPWAISAALKLAVE